VDQGHHVFKNLLIWGVIQHYVYEAIPYIDDLQKRLMQTWFNLTKTLPMLYDWPVA